MMSTTEHIENTTAQQAKMEGFKPTEVGLIPEDWEVLELSEIIDFLDGRRKPIKSSERAKMKGPFPYYGASGVIDYVNDYLFDDELILLGEDGENILSRNLQLAFVIKGKVWVNNHAHVLKTKDSFNTHFIAEKLESLNYENYNSGTAQPKLNKRTCAKIKLSLPPSLSEQRAIATALSDMDALIAAQEQLIAKKRSIKQGAMQELLEPKEGWEEKTLHQLSDNKKELFDDGDWIEAEHITDKGIRIIQTGNIGIGKYIEKENKKYIFEKSFHKLNCKHLIHGDLLICRLADPAGRACILPNIGEAEIVTSVDVTIFRPRKEVANRIFLKNIFSTSEWFQKVIERVGGTTHKRISRSALGSISIEIPSIDEQNRIATILSEMDAEIEQLEGQLAKYRKLKKGMMQELLTGRKRLIESN